MDFEFGLIQIGLARFVCSQLLELGQIALDLALGLQIVHLDLERDRIQPVADAGGFERAGAQAEHGVDSDRCDNSHQKQYGGEASY